MESEAAAPQLEEAGPLLELLLQHLQALFGGGGAPLPAGLAFVCTDRQRDPAAAAGIIGACWRALTLSAHDGARLLVSHSDAAVLVDLSAALAGDDVPHTAVEAGLHDPAGLMAAAAAAGIGDLRDFVFIASMSECCRQAGGSEGLLGWADLAAQHGIVSLDFFEQGRSSRRGSLAAVDSSSGSEGAPGAATLGGSPEFLLPQTGRRLQKALSMVREASEEGLMDDLSASQLETVEEEAEEGEDWGSSAAAVCDDASAAAATAASAAATGTANDASAAAATAAEQAAPLPESSGSSSSSSYGMQRASQLLAAAAAAGLVPRPGEGCHLTLDGAAGSGSALLLHLDTIPFAIRYGCHADADHLFWLHSYAVAGGLQRNVLTLEQIRQALVPATPDAPPLCFVAEIGGYPAAALLLQPVGGAAEAQLARQPAGQQGRRLQLLLAAVFPEMQERAQVLAALVTYALQQLVADGATLTVQQGALLVLPALQRLAPTAFDGMPASAASADPLAPLLTVATSPFGTATDPAQVSWLLHRTQFAPGLSLDGFVLAVSAHMQEFSASPQTSITALAAAPPDAAAVAAVVRAARRISQAWQDAGPAGAGAEEAAAEELVGEVTAVVTGFMDAAGFPTDGFAAHTPLMDAGLDSLDMLKLASLLSESLGMALPSTILFDYPSVEALCGYILAAQVPPAGAGGSSRRGSLVALSPGMAPLAQMQPGRLSGSARRTTAGYAGRRTTAGYRRRTTTQDGGRRVTHQSMFAHGTLATVPLDGRRATVTPGGAIVSGGVPTLQVVFVETAAQRLPSGSHAHSAASFGVDMPVPVPHARWDWEAHAAQAAAAGSRSPARFGGFLPDIAAFDSSLFSIPAGEAALLDPQQRLLLETAWEASSVPGASGASLLARAGRAGKAPAKAAAAAGVGVFVGASYAEWALLQQAQGLAPGAYTASGSGLSVLAGRVSYVFGWTGPATVTETACSSSLVALSAAHQSLQLGVSRNALAGGLNLMMHPATTEMYNVAGMLAPDGRCKTLDAAADGYVRSEAALAIVLRAIDSLTAAATEGGGLHASMGAVVLLLGSAVNQDGRSSSLTAPNGPSQQALFRAAAASGSLPASRVNLLSMHGTGTSLGDPIEVGAALAVLMHKRKAADGPLALAASKAAVGHAEAGAGLVGFAAAVLCAEGRALPQMLHLSMVNPYVQQCIDTACKPSPSSPDAIPAVSAPRAHAALPAAAQHGRLTAGVSAFAFQGTNAHALMEVLDLGSCLSVFSRSQHLSSGAILPVWQRASYWLAPPASQLLTTCLGKAAGAAVVLQGRLQAPAVAALVRAAGASGGWAVAAEAACAAAASLAAVADGKHQLPLGLAGAAVSPAAAHSLATGTQLQAAVDARRGSIAVAVDGSQPPLLTASIAACAELSLPGGQHCYAHRSDLLAQLLQPVRVEAATAISRFAADAAQHAQHMHGIFVQPALLQSGSQLQQLSAADSDAQQAEPAAFECLLPASSRSGSGSNRSSSGCKALVAQRNLWHGSACQRTLRLCSGSGCSLQLSGLQWRHAAQHNRASVAAAAADSSEDIGCSYVASWQAVQPQQAAFASSPHRRASALIACRSGRNGSHQRAAWLPHSRRGGLQAGEAACFRAMQALQTAAATGAHTLSLTSVAAAEAASPAPLSSGSSAAAASSAALFAMLRCAANELPGVAFSAGSLDAAAAGPSLAGAAPWDASYSCHGQQWSAGRLLAARLLPAAPSQHSTEPAAPAQQQQWAVSGGTGSLGILVATWLQLRQAGRLLLLGRSGRLADAASASLLAADCLLSACMCDAAMQDDAAAALDSSASAAGRQPLTGLVHAGGILRDAALHQQTAATIRAVHAPKAAGLARLLSAAGQAAPLQQALLFSSIAAVIGPAGSANYAAANAALDAAASQLQLQGLTSSSIQWGAWGGIGMVASNAAVHRAMQRSGVGMLQPRQGLAAMRQLLDSVAAAPQLAAIPFVWGRFMQAARNAAAFFYGEHTQQAGGSPAGQPPAPQQAEAAAQPALSEADLLAQVLAVVAAVHGEAVESQQPLLQAGLDSLGAVELRNSLQRSLGVQLPGTLVFDYPTATAIAAHCHQLLAAAAAAVRPSPGSAAPAAAGPSFDDLLAAVAAAVQTVGGTADLAPEAPFLSAGLDSLSAVELRDELQRSLGLRLPGTLIFDYPTPTSLAAFLQQQAVQATGAIGSTADPSSSFAIQRGSGATLAGAVARSSMLVTIDATASRLAAPSISSTADSCRLTPYARWDADGSARHGVPHRPGSRFARWLEGVEQFDAAAFGIGVSEALLIDPQHRLMLEGAWEVLSAYCAAQASPDNGNVAVVAAQSFWDYAQQTDRALPGVGETYKATGHAEAAA